MYVYLLVANPNPRPSASTNSHTYIHTYIHTYKHTQPHYTSVVMPDSVPNVKLHMDADYWHCSNEVSPRS
jgi:hypothetical protein